LREASPRHGPAILKSSNAAYIKAVGLSESVIAVTTPNVPGYRIKRVLGLVHGLTIRTRGVWGRTVASLKGIFGGKIGAYVSELKKAKDEALQLLKGEAARLGANAIVGVDFETSSIFGDFMMVSAHGTAVVIEPEE